MKPPVETQTDAPTPPAASPAVEKAKAPEAAKTEPEGKVYLTTRPSKAFGGRGRFVTPNAAELAAAADGLLVEPTAEQLAQRA